MCVGAADEGYDIGCDKVWVEARGRWKPAGPPDSCSVHVRCSGNAKDGDNAIDSFGNGESDQRRGQRSFNRASYHVYGGQRPQAQGSLRNVDFKGIDMQLVHLRNHR